MDKKGFWIRNAMVLNGDGRDWADVRVEGGRIAAVVDRADGALCPVEPGDCDGSGLWLLPGGVDVHTHFGMPLASGARSLGWRDSSTAALLGGTTTIVDFANPDRGEPITDAVSRWRAAAADRCLCDWGLHATVSDASPERLAEIPALVAAGIPTFKAFLAYKDRLMLTPEELAALMTAVHDAGARLLLHAEMGETNAAFEQALIDTGRTAAHWHPAAHPAESEIEAVRTAIDIAGLTGCPLSVVHVSTAGALAEIAAARAAGLDVTAEACPHHLYRDEFEYQRGYGAALAAVLSPPLRSAADSAALRLAIAAGDVSHIATDHCEFPLHVKRDAARDGFAAIPNGAGGVGERLIVVYSESVKTGGITPEQWVRLCCESPARLMGLGSRKGRISEGFDADLVLFDHDAIGTVLPRTESASLWAGSDWRGEVRDVWLRGEATVIDGIIAQDAGAGKFLERSLTT